MSSPSSNPPDSLKSELKEIPDLSQHLVEIEIEKDPEKGFGFNIVGGTDEPYVPGCTGIFISRINPEGPAAKDGRLRLGDRIAALNDISLASKTHSDAVDIFRQASGKVRLLIEQDAETLLLSRPCAVFASNSQTNVPAVICTPPGSAPVRAIIVEEDDDKASTISHAPSVHSVIDDVPKTPKKPSSWFDPTNPSLVTEAIFISIGAISIGLAIAFAVRYYKRR